MSTGHKHIVPICDIDSTPKQKLGHIVGIDINCSHHTEQHCKEAIHVNERHGAKRDMGQISPLDTVVEEKCGATLSSSSSEGTVRSMPPNGKGV